MKKTKGILWGVAIIAVGIFWGLTASGTINVDLFFDGWWTLFIIIPSLVGLITDKNKTGSLILLLMGIVLLLSNYIDFARFKWIVWPAIVVIIGVAIILNNVFDNKANSQPYQAPPVQHIPNPNGIYSSSFNNKNLVFDSNFGGAKFNTTFGGMKVDLRRANIQNNAVVEVESTFGGTEIFVPPYVRVVSSSSNLFGGVTDKSNKNLPQDAPTLFVNSKNTFGGTDIML